MIADRTYTDPRIVRTRALIVRAFNELLDEKGFQSLTVGDITDRAAVNRTTFYAHFEDKHALFAYATQDGFRSMVREKVSAPFGPLYLRQLIGTLGNFLLSLKQACAVTLVAFESMVAGQVVSVIESTLANELASGEDTPQPLTLTVASWGMYGAVSRWVLTKGTPLDEGAIDQVVRLIAPMLDGAASTALH